MSEPPCVLYRLYSRQGWTIFAHQKDLQKSFPFFAEIPLLQVVNDCEMINLIVVLELVLFSELLTEFVEILCAGVLSQTISLHWNFNLNGRRPPRCLRPTLYSK